MQYSYFSVISVISVISLIKKCILFERVCSSPSPHPTQSWNSEKNARHTRPTIVCGVRGGVGSVWIGHFWVPKTLTFKMRLGAQPFLWKWVLFAWEWKMISIPKAEHLPLFWNKGPGKLGNMAYWKTPQICKIVPRLLSMIIGVKEEVKLKRQTGSCSL